MNLLLSKNVYIIDVSFLMGNIPITATDQHEDYGEELNCHCEHLSLVLFFLLLIVFINFGHDLQLFGDALCVDFMRILKQLVLVISFCINVVFQSFQFLSMVIDTIGGAGRIIIVGHIPLKFVICLTFGIIIKDLLKSLFNRFKFWFEFISILLLLELNFGKFLRLRIESLLKTMNLANLFALKLLQVV